MNGGPTSSEDTIQSVCSSSQYEASDFFLSQSINEFMYFFLQFSE